VISFHTSIVSRFAATAVLVSLVFLTPGSVRAQTRVGSYCNAGLIELQNGAADPPAVARAVRQQLRQGVARAVVFDPFRDQIAGIAEANAGIRDPFLRQLDSLIAIVPRDTNQLAVVDESFDVQSTDDGYVLFLGTPDRLLLTEATDTSVLRIVCHTAFILNAATSEINRAARAAALAELEENAKSWSRWEADAWSTFPWEAWLHLTPFGKRCIASERLGPPSCSIAFLHPHVGLVSQMAPGEGLRLDQIETRQELVWDIIGLRRYRPDGRATWGFSIVGVSNGGVGLSLSRGRAWQAGILFASVFDSQQTSRFVLSVDALRSFLSASKSVEESHSKLRKRTEEFRRALDP
jgi:hypothetical protein